MGVEAKCVFHLRKPAHIGYKGKGRQVRDSAGNPLVPWIALAAQIQAEGTRIAQALGKPEPRFKVSDGFVAKPKWLKRQGQEYFLGDIQFRLQAKTAQDLEICLAAVKFLENAGIGAETTKGYGYGQAEFLVEPESKEIETLKLPTRIANILSQNWRSWKKARGDFPFTSRVFWRGELEGKISSSRLRWILRQAMIQITGVEHEKTTVCPPDENPCPVCEVLGSLAKKSRVTVRTFCEKEKTKAYVIMDSLSPDELDLILEALKPLGFTLDRTEALKDLFPSAIK